MNKKRDCIKKSLSVFLSLLMVIGTFCFFNPFALTEAEAATAGSYYYYLYLYTSNGAKLDSLTIDLYYKTNNGKGGETSKQIWNGGISSGDLYSDNTGKAFTGSVPGWPTKAVMKFKIPGGNRGFQIDQNDKTYLCIGSTQAVANAKTYKVASGFGFGEVSSGLFSSKSFEKTLTFNTTYPSVSSISISGGDLTATVPSDTSTVTRTTSSATVYDQYGVQWYQEPDEYILCDSATSTSKLTVNGITCTATNGGDTSSVTVKKAANEWVSNGGANYQRTVYIRAKKGNIYSGAKKLTLTNYRISAKFYDYSESTLDWTSLKQSTTPFYNYDVVKSPTVARTGWKFNGWSTSKAATSGSASVSQRIKDNSTWYAQWTKTLTGRFNYFTASGTATSKDSSTTLFTKDTAFTATAPSDVPSTITYDGRTFKFLGWREDTSAAAADTTDFTIYSNYNSYIDSVKQFYAVYSSDINFRFDGNGGTVSGANKKQTQYLNASGNKTSHTFDLGGVSASLANTDYVGWAETADANDAVASNRTFTITSDKTVYAVYKCNVRFLNQGAVYSTATVTRNHVAADPSPLPGTAPASRPLKAFDDVNEYFFTGWDKSLVITGHTDINAVFETVPHTYVEINTPEYPKKDPTCTEGGIRSYECSHVRNDDGEVCHYIKTEAVSALGHDLVKTAGKAPTCTEKGYTDSSQCSRCGFVEKESVELPANGHTWGEFFDTESDCKTNGVHERICTVCGAEDLDTKVVKPLDSTKHKEIVIPGKAATCTENGMTEYTECSVCGAILKAGSTVISEGHEWVVVEGEEAVAPTCTEDGRTAHIVCGRAGCTAEKQQSKVIPALGHNYVDLPAKEPTCTEKGNTSGSYCTKCGDGNVTFIPALGHDFVNLTEVRSATCSEEGLKVGGCTRCGEGHVEEVIPKLPHTPEEIPAVEATCSSFGYTAGEKCSVCETVTVEPQKIKMLDHTWEKTDDGRAATCIESGITASFTCSVCGAKKGGDVIKKLGHSYGEVVVTKKASCGVAGEKLLRCGNCGDTKTEIIPALTHNYVTVDAVEATCTKSGLTAGVRCANCGEQSTAPEIVEAKGHTFGDVITIDATCTSEGRKYKVCSVCHEEETVEVLAKLDHTEKEVPAVPATCTRAGKTAGVECAVCGEVLVAPVNVEPVEHTAAVDVEAKAATCAYGGNTEGTKCAVCGKTLVKARNISASEHTFSSWETVINATCTAQGVKERHCTADGCTYSERTFTPAPGHSYGDWAVTVDPSCENDGTKQCVCSRCGDVIDQTVPALGHSKVTVSAVPATCEFDGVTEGVECSVCGVRFEGFDVIPAIGHDYEMTHVEGDCDHDSYDLFVCKHDSSHTYISNVEIASGHEGGTATCTQRAVCAVCGKEYGDYAAHTYEAVVTAPTCSSAGYTTYTCTLCGDSYEGDRVPATGEHNFADGIVTKAPTCTESGSKTVTCKDCGFGMTVEISATGHNVTDWTVEGSKKTGTCTVCGETVTENATQDDVKACERCGYHHTRSTGLFKYKGVFCSITYFFRQIVKFFKGGK